MVTGKRLERQAFTLVKKTDIPWTLYSFVVELSKHKFTCGPSR